MKIGECCLACLEKIGEYITNSAYAYMAVSGDSFCTSAWNGFLLQVKHCSEFSFAKFVAEVFIFIAKLAIVFLSAFTCYQFMKLNGDLEEVDSIVGPILITALFGFVTAQVLLGQFDEAVLAMMNCVAIDMDLNHGVPLYGPPTFHDALEGLKSGDKVDDADKQGNSVQEGGAAEV